MKKIVILLSIATLFFFLPKVAFAHVLQTDGNIGAVLHIDPDDDPIAGQQSSFFFEFKDKQSKFQPTNCNCTFSILENGKDIYTQPLFQNNTDPNLQNASIFFTFPQKDVYQIKVTGKPNSEGAFQHFNLTYDIRVERVSNDQANNQQSGKTQTWFSTHLIHFGATGVGLIIILISVLRQILNKRNTNMKGGEKKDDKKDTGNIY